MACKNFYNLEPDMVWRQVYPLAEAIYPHTGRAFLSLSCNHCVNPVCVTACPTASYSQRKDGIVIHNMDTCIGCQNCIRSCPYGAPRYNKILGKAQKCGMCWERLDAGLQPSCVLACMTGALQLINLEDYPEAGIVQYPEGYPVMKKINPSTRFILPKMPTMPGVKS